MRKMVGMLVLAFFVVGGCSAGMKAADTAGSSSAVLEIAGPIQMGKKAQAVINGKGFAPGQEVSLLFTSEDGTQTDIGYALEPAPKADDSGAWSTTWSCGRFVAKKMVKAGGSYSLSATDSDYTPIAKTTVTFQK